MCVQHELRRVRPRPEPAEHRRQRRPTVLLDVEALDPEPERSELALDTILASNERPDFAAVKALAAPEKPTIPIIHIPPPDLSVYDGLLAGGAS